MGESIQTLALGILSSQTWKRLRDSANQGIEELPGQKKRHVCTTYYDAKQKEKTSLNPN